MVVQFSGNTNGPGVRRFFPLLLDRGGGVEVRSRQFQHLREVSWPVWRFDLSPQSSPLAKGEEGEAQIK